MDDLREALVSARRTMASSSQDWSAARDFAWLYGILVGWPEGPTAEDPDAGDALTGLAERFGWTEADKALLRRHRAVLRQHMAAHGLEDPTWAGMSEAVKATLRAGDADVLARSRCRPSPAEGVPDDEEGTDD